MQKVSDRIRIGNQSAFTAKLWKPFEYAVENGFDAFEWLFVKYDTWRWLPGKLNTVAGNDENDLAMEDRKRIREISLAKDIALSLHAPFSASFFTQKGIQRLEDSFRFAQDIGVRLVNVHLDKYEGIPKFVEAALPFFRQQSSTGLKIAVENTPGDTPQDMNEFFALLFEVYPEAKTFIGMCIDLGHANLAPYSNNIWAFIDDLAPDMPIIHVHIHENYGKNDDHLPVFTGPSKVDPTGMKGVLRRLWDRGFTGAMIMEQWPKPPSILKDSRDKVLSCFKELV